MNTLQKAILAASTVGVIVLSVVVALDLKKEPLVGAQGPQGAQGAPGRDGKDGSSVRGPQGPAGKDGLGSVVSTDLPTGYLSLGGGAVHEGSWQTFNQGTSTLCALSSGEIGILATSTLSDAIVRIESTSTQGAIITFHKITSAYSTGFSTSVPTLTELGSTTIDLLKGTTTVGLMLSTSSIMNDPDGSNFDPAVKEEFNNRWHPLTDRLLVTIDAKNVNTAAGGVVSESFNLNGACGAFWRAVK